MKAVRPHSAGERATEPHFPTCLLSPAVERFIEVRARDRKNVCQASGLAIKPMLLTSCAPYKIKRRPLATRYDELAANQLTFIQLASIRL
jgi:hypothetical protein